MKLSKCPVEGLFVTVVAAVVLIPLMLDGNAKPDAGREQWTIASATWLVFDKLLTFIFAAVGAWLVAWWVNKKVPEDRRRDLTEGIEVKALPRHESRIAFQVLNHGKGTAVNACVSVKLEYTESDFFGPLTVDILHDRGHTVPWKWKDPDREFNPSSLIRRFTEPRFERLAWNTTGFPQNFSIYASDSEKVVLFEILDSMFSGPEFSEPSILLLHSGTSMRDEEYTMFLIGRTYEGTIKVSSDGTDSKLFSFKIDPADELWPLKIVDG